MWTLAPLEHVVPFHGTAVDLITLPKPRRSMSVPAPPKSVRGTAEIEPRIPAPGLPLFLRGPRRDDDADLPPVQQPSTEPNEVRDVEGGPNDEVLAEGSPSADRNAQEPAPDRNEDRSFMDRELVEARAGSPSAPVQIAQPEGPILVSRVPSPEARDAARADAARSDDATAPAPAPTAAASTRSTPPGAANDAAEGATTEARGDPALGVDSADGANTGADADTSEGAAPEGEPDGSSGESRTAAPPGDPSGDASGGAAPGPDPTALLEAVPDRTLTVDETATLFESGRTPDDDRVEVRRQLEELNGFGRGAQTRISRIEAERGAAIDATAFARAAEVRSAVDASLEDVRGHHDGLRLFLEESIAAAVARVEAERERAGSAVRAAAAAAVSQSSTDVSTRQQTIRTAATNEQKQPMAVANREASRADGELEGAAQKCIGDTERVAGRYPGSSSRRRRQRAAARKVGTKSAANIRDNKPGLTRGLLEKGREFEGGYLEVSSAVSAQLVKTLPRTAASIGDAGAGAIRAIHTAAGRILAALESLRGAGLAALDENENRVAGDVVDRGNAALVAIDGRRRAERGLLAHRAEAARGSVRAAVVESRQAWEDNAHPHVETVAGIVSTARQAIRDRERSFAETSGEQVAVAQTAIASLASEGLEQTSIIASEGIARGEATLEAALARMNEAVERWSASVAVVLTKLQVMLTAILAQAREQMDELNRLATAKMVETTTLFRERLTRDNGKSIAEAKKPLTDSVESRADRAAQKAGRSTFVRILSGIFSGLWNLIKGLVIAILLAALLVLLLPITFATAMLVVFGGMLVYGFVTNLMSRIEQRRQMGMENDVAWYELGAMALSDTVGITGVFEMISGKDTYTFEDLSVEERASRGTVGAGTMAFTWLGVRSGVGHVRSVRAGEINVFRGTRSVDAWSGLRDAISNKRDAPSAKELGRAFREQGKEGLREIQNVLRLGGAKIRSAGTWARSKVRGFFERLFGKEPPAPPSTATRPIEPQGDASRPAYDQLAADHAVDPVDVALMRDTGLPAELFGRLLRRGMDPTTLAELGMDGGPRAVQGLEGLVRAGLEPTQALGAVRGAVTNPSVLTALNRPGIADMIARLVVSGQTPARAVELVRLGVEAEAAPAARGEPVLDMIAEMINSGRLVEPRSFVRKFEAAHRELAQGSRGTYAELLRTLEGIRAGHEMGWGTREGDIVRYGRDASGNRTVLDVRQSKVVTSRYVDTLIANIESAIRQLAGRGGHRGQNPEQAPVGARRTVDITVAEGNPLVNATRAEILAALRNKIDYLPDLQPSGAPNGRIIIRNARGTFEFDPAELGKSPGPPVPTPDRPDRRSKTDEP